jgi:arylsulfatase A-like enzyme
MPIGSIDVVTWPRTLAGAVRACALIAVSSFAIDLAGAKVRLASLSHARMRGWLAGLALALLLALVIGLVLGAMRALAARGGGAGSGGLARAGAWLWRGTSAEQRGRVASLIGGSWTVLAFAGASFVVTREAVLSIAQPRNAAAVIVVAQLGLAAAALALFPLMRGLGDYLARLSALPGLGWIFRSAGRLLVVTAGAVVLLVVFVSVRNWSTVQYLPFQRLAATLGAPILAYALVLVARAFGRAGSAVGSALFVCVAISGLGALIAFQGRGDEQTGLQQTIAGQAGVRAARFALDFDRDGVLNVLGGGDCAPFDARLSPLAIDIPNDHLDQDCDGVDLDDRLLGPAPRRDYRPPKGFPKRPVVVLLTVDALAARHTGAFGYPRKVTPQLDEFARGGTLFRFAFAQGPSTRLSFPAMFTSRYDSQIAQRLVGSHPYPIEDTELMLAELLAGEGYDTTAILSDGYFRKSRWGSLLAGFSRVIDSAIGSPSAHNSVAVTDAAIRAVESRRSRPLFLWVHYYDAHSPHSQPPAKDAEKFGTSRKDLYDAELQLVDREAGRLLDYLETTFAGQAVVFVTGDHGIAFDGARHGRLNYGYDLSTAVLHVPLIVRGPLIRPQVIDRVASTMDIAPTVASLVRARASAPFEGASLVPELFDGTATRMPLLMHQFFLQERRWEDEDPLEQISVRDDRYSLIHDRKRGGFQLYDYRKDYYETHDLSAEPAFARELAALRQKLALLTYRTYAGERVQPEQASAREVVP